MASVVDPIQAPAADEVADDANPTPQFDPGVVHLPMVKSATQVPDERNLVVYTGKLSPATVPTWVAVKLKLDNVIRHAAGQPTVFRDASKAEKPTWVAVTVSVNVLPQLAGLIPPGATTTLVGGVAAASTKSLVSPPPRARVIGLTPSPPDTVTARIDDPEAIVQEVDGLFGVRVKTSGVVLPVTVIDRWLDVIAPYVARPAALSSSPKIIA